MSRFIKNSALVVSFLMVVAMVVGCSSRLAPQSGKELPSSGSSFNAPTNGLVQSNTGGGVTIDIEWIRAEGNSLVFNVTMSQQAD